MASIEVGMEILPNIYIEKIEISDYSSDSFGCNVSMMAVENLSTPWSDNEMLMKNMKAIFFGTNNSGLITSIDNGNTFNTTTIKRASKAINENPRLSTTSYGIKNIQSFVRHSTFDKAYYKTEFNFVFPKSLSKMNFYCAFFMDPKDLTGNMGIDLNSIFVTNILGPVASEQIITDGKVNYESSVFVMPSGVMWSGPVHYHPNRGYMAGSSHSAKPHATLNVKKVHNSKIRDYREDLVKKATKPVDELTDKNVHKLIDVPFFPYTALWNSFDDNTNVTGLFGVNYRDIILNKTKYGQALLNLDKDFVNQALSSLRLKNFILQRNKVVSDYVYSPKGLLKQGVSRILDERIINFSHDQNDILKSNLRVRKNKKFFDVSPSDLSSTANVKNISENQVYIEDLVQEKKISEVSQVFLDNDNNIRYYEFIDYKINSKSIGEYQYKIKISFFDPTVTMVHNILIELKRQYSAIKRFINLFATHSNYDYDLEKPKKNFLDVVSLQTSNTSPHVVETIIATYIKYSSFLYDLSDSQMDEMTNKYLNYLNPVSADLRSVRAFLLKYENMIFDMYEFFGFDISSIKDMSTASNSKIENKNFISMEHSFDEIIEPSMYEKFYNFMDAGTGITKRIPYNDYKISLEQEQEKYFSKPISFPVNKKDGTDPAIPKNLNKRSRTRYRFLSPKRVSSLKEKIDLRNLATIDRSTFNMFFGNVRSDKFVKSKIPKSKYLVDLPFELQKESLEYSRAAPVDLSTNDLTKGYKVFSKRAKKEGKFVSSVRFLGEDSNFVNYDVIKDYCSINPVKSSLKNKKKRKKMKLKLSRPSSRENIPSYKRAHFKLNDSKNLLKVAQEREANFERYVEELPIQVKAAFGTAYNFTKQNWVKSTSKVDPIESPDTSKVFNVTYLTICEAQVFDGYETYKNGTNMRRPIWRKLESTDMNSKENLLCRLMYYIDGHMNITDKSQVNLPYSDKYFILTTDTLSSKRPKPPTRSSLVSKIRSALSTSIVYDSNHLTSNIIIQPVESALSDFMDHTGPSVPDAPTDTRTFSTPDSITTTGGYTGASPMGGMGTTTPTGVGQGGGGTSGGGGGSGGGGTGGGY